jgi:hypothetical protein
LTHTLEGLAVDVDPRVACRMHGLAGHVGAQRS